MGRYDEDARSIEAKEITHVAWTDDVGGEGVRGISPTHVLASGWVARGAGWRRLID